MLLLLFVRSLAHTTLKTGSIFFRMAFVVMVVIVVVVVVVVVAVSVVVEVDDAKCLLKIIKDVFFYILCYDLHRSN